MRVAVWPSRGAKLRPKAKMSNTFQNARAFQVQRIVLYRELALGSGQEGNLSTLAVVMLSNNHRGYSTVIMY